jgi:type I restriction enzyme S subunit
MAFNQGCKGIVPRQDLVDAEYLQYWLWAHRERLQSLGTGSTFMELGNDALLGFGVALPPVSQQRAIAAFVRQQFALIDTVVLARQRQLTLIADRRVARLEAMLRMVTAKGAEPVPLRRLLRPRQEQDRTDLAVLSIYRDHGVVPKASRSDNFNATPEDLTRYQRVAVNDLVVNKMKAWSGSVAVSPEEGIVSPDYLVCRIEDRVEPRFLHHVLRSPKLVTEMRIRSRGIRPNQERLYWDDLADIRIPLPTRADQARMAAEVDEALGEYESEREPLVKSVQLLVESKRSLILAAVGGRVTVPDTSDVES